MKFNKWTVALAAAGLVSIGHKAQAEEGYISALSKTTLSGFVDTSASISSLQNDEMHWGRLDYQGAEKQNGFNLDVVQLSLESPLDESDWASGYKVDLLFGPDSLDYTQHNVRQAYVNTRVPVGNGLELKMGVFDAIVGYEGFSNRDNPNYSRNMAYAFQPFNHTGLLASYQVNDALSFNVGAANTNRNTMNDRADDVDGHQGSVDLGDISYMASITYDAQSGALEGASLTAAVLTGPNTANGSIDPFQPFSGGKALHVVSPLDGSIVNHESRNLAGDNTNRGDNILLGDAGTDDTTNFYLGATIPTPIDGLSLGAAYDHVDNAKGNGIDVDVFALYASYQATDKLSLHGRIEYLDGDNGIFGDDYVDSEIGAISPVYSDDKGVETFAAVDENGDDNFMVPSDYYTDSDGGVTDVEFDIDENKFNEPIQKSAVSSRRDNDVEMLSLTATVQYDLWENVLTRVEARYDQQVDDNADNFAGDDDVFTLTLNAVYSF
jgi:hypothetical protein